MPPWERYQTAQQAAPQAPQQQAQPPRTIGGNRVLGGVPASEQRAQRGEDRADAAAARAAAAAERANANSANANTIAQERLRLAQQTAERQQAEFEGTGGTGTEAQNKLSTLLTRVMGGFRDIAGEVQGNPNAQSPGLAETASRAVLGEGVITRGISGEDRRIVSDAQRDMIDALLTMSTGAAYTPEQVVAQQVAYFPQWGDSQREVELKNQRLRRLIEAARAVAGPQWAEIEATITPLMPQVLGQQASATGDREADPAIGGSLTGGGANGGSNGGGGTNPDGPLTGNVSEAVYDAQGREVGGDYTGPAFNAQGERVGDIVRTENGREWAQPDAVTRADQLESRAGRSDFTDLAAQGIMLGLGDESAGVGEAIAGALTGDFDLAGNYQRGNQAQDIVYQRARERSGGLGTAAELLGGGGAIRAAPGAFMAAGRMAAARNGGNLTREGMRGAMTFQAARDGAAVGALGGFGYGEGLEGSATNALIGGAFGGAAGYAGQRVGNALAARSDARLPAQATQQAADNLGVQLAPAMTGGPGVRMASAGAQQGFISRGPVVNAVERMQGQAQAARQGAAQSAGRIVPADDAGEMVRRGAEVYSKTTAQTGGRLYERAHRLAQNVRVKLNTAVQRADAFIAEVGQAPGGADGAMARDLTTLRDQMAGGAFTPQGIRQMRTALREQMQERGLRGSNTDRMLGEIVDAAENDMIAGLRQAGRDSAADAYQTASQFWRERVQTIDQVLEPVLGKNAPRSGEQILSSLERMGRRDSGNAANLRRLMQAMPSDEAASVRATVINRLGRPSKGAGEVIDDNSFSLERFLTHWNDMSSSARSVMFPPESVKALNDLATLGAAAKRAGSSMNTSNTAGSLAVQTALTGAAAWAINPWAAGGGLAAQYGVGRLLASPRFARWLAGAPRNAGNRSAHLAKLGDIARAEPAIAGDIALYMRAINDNGAQVPNVAANSPQDQTGDNRQPATR